MIFWRVGQTLQVAASQTVVLDTPENRRVRHRKPNFDGISEDPGVALGETTGILTHKYIAGERQSWTKRATIYPTRTNHAWRTRRIMIR